MTEPQKVNELMKPRWKAISPTNEHYPNSPFTVGDIYSESAIQFSTGDNAIGYPHLFQPLPWYAERTVEEMPGFVKSDDEDQFVLKVEKYLLHKESKNIWAFEYLWENESDIKRMSLNGWIPCTSHDYETYLKSKV